MELRELYETDSDFRGHVDRYCMNYCEGKRITVEEALTHAMVRNYAEQRGEKRMRVLPILFNTDMVRAIMDGRKTVTRRVVKPQPTKAMIHKLGICVDGDKNDIGKFGFGSHECGGHVCYVKPPYKIGDILYVRETWSEWIGGYLYKAWTSPFAQPGECKAMKWHPSIHMPKEAARIFLKVKDVRVERLQDITEEQALKEGIHYDECPSGYTWKQITSMVDCYTSAVGAFRHLWYKTIKRDDVEIYGWDANPWVWVIEFERCEKPENF